ncbi:Endonuclease-reverse transcriptase/Reverse transcriptase (RNA-dependent DNA polymerase), putative [Trypanosoma equiperdum]|uniref:Endonuclease-reverse transcriptase/Reverse transcriptase (RNA-dependent DNA polymerase), putative n=1 Tax=Trypanosoma equiperdum TaxID=5694 RepID=A0A1G4IJK3_TRYEQ|nr:Endonuclease-reverse transcriptase/Reverse transcriptase (RNA-dependent DNA polymerase), putative [Trypanosoma equiperdum]
MPATPSWFQGPVPRLIWGSKEPATAFFVRKRTLVQGLRHHLAMGQAASQAETRYYQYLSLGMCRRTISSIIRAEILLSGDVEKNPGPVFRGPQWNCAGLTQGKRLALHRILIEERVSFYLLCETKFSSLEEQSLHLPLFQQYRAARNVNGGEVSILARENLPIEVGEKKVGQLEHVSATIHVSEEERLTLTPAYFPRRRSAENLEKLAALERDESHIKGADVNSHSYLRDREVPPDAGGKAITTWCADTGYNVAKTGDRTSYDYARNLGSSPDVTLNRECQIINWTAIEAPDSDHYVTLFDVIVGNNDIPIALARLDRALFSWKKPDWVKFNAHTKHESKKIGNLGNIRDATVKAVPPRHSAAKALLDEGANRVI